MSLNTTRVTGDIVDAVDVNQIAEAVNANTDNIASLMSDGVGGARVETYTGPAALALGTATVGTVRQFYVAVSGNIDGIPVAQDEFHTFGRTSTGWHHYVPASGVPTPVTSDTTRPSDVPSLTANVNGTNVLLQWDAATDNVAVESYDVSMDGGATVTANVLANGGRNGFYVREYTFTGLAPTTSYTFGIKARDLAGNVSANWRTTTVTTGATSDSAPPSAPGALTTTPDMTAILVSWSAATDDVGVTKYRISSNGGTSWTEIGNVTSHTLTGLTASTSYSIAVQAGDAAGNWGPSATKTVSTTSSPAPGGDDFTGTTANLTEHPNTTIGTPKPWGPAVLPGASGGGNSPNNWKLASDALVDNFAQPGAAQVFDWGGTDGVVTAGLKLASATPSANDRLGIVLRYVDADNYAYAYIETTVLVVRQKVAGTDTAIGSQTVTLAANTFHTVAATLNGTSISVTVNGGAAITGTLAAAINGTRYGVQVPPIAGTAAGAAKRAWDYLHVDPLP